MTRRLTLDEAIAGAKRRPSSDLLALWILDTFGEDVPCGFDTPTASTVVEGCIFIPDQYGGATVSANESRALCTAILRAADEAER